MQQQATLDYILQLLSMAGLAQVLMSEGYEPGRMLALRVSRQDDADGLWPAFTYGPEQLCAIHIRHAHVGDDDIAGSCLHSGQRQRTVLDELHVPLCVEVMKACAQPL